MPLHDASAWAAVLEFAEEFKPHLWIMGGDTLDCGCISHHNHGKPGQTEGLRLLADAQGCIEEVIKPVEAIAKDLVYLVGNHEHWLQQLIDTMPTLDGIVDLQSILKLSKRWKIVWTGGVYNLGKLTFMHGDTLGGGEHIAKAAVIAYERSVRFGHFHTYQTYTKSSPVDYKNAKSGICVPCLCTKIPEYARNKPNRWVQGFNWGYVEDNGFYTDYVSVIVDGGFRGPDGKRYGE